MSWQCPYCETVNQDAVPLCTVCDHIAPVIESFLSLEEIEYAREYAERLSEINRYESSGEYHKMLECAMRAIASYRHNDIAVKKAHIALKLDMEAQMKNQLLSIIDKSISEGNFLLAGTTIKIWVALKFDSEIIKDKKEIVLLRLEEQAFVDEVKSNLAEALLTGDFNKGSAIIDKSLLKYPENKVLLELKTQLMDGNKLHGGQNKGQTTPRTKFPPVKRPYDKTITGDSEAGNDKPCYPQTKTRKFPKVKRNNT